MKKLINRRRAARQRVAVYGSFVVLCLGFYAYQPIRMDLFPRAIPSPNPDIDPDSAKLFSPTAKVVVVTAHPDDCEFYGGALMARLKKAGAKVSLIVCTDGDKGFYPWADAQANRKVRRTEQTEAAKRWGSQKVTYLANPDGRLQPRDEVVAQIKGSLGDAEWIFTFDGDYPPKVGHGDHRSAGQAAEIAARDSGAKWLVRFSTHAPNHTFDVSGFDVEQRKLIDIHKSQFYGQKEEFVWNKVFESGLEDGAKIDAEYGLSVRVEKLR